MSQPADSTENSKKKHQYVTSRNSKHKLKSVPSNSSYISIATDNERLDTKNIDQSEKSKIISNPGTSWADMNKTNSGTCISGRRLWTSSNKYVEKSSNVPVHVNNIIEEESEFISMVTKQLYLAESQMQKMQNLLSKAEERLQNKDQEIERFKRKVKDLEIKCKNQETFRKKEQQRTDQINNSEYLYKRCLLLEQKIFEMEKFLADYGLIWVGDNDTSTLNSEYAIDNYIETYYEQLIANIDQLNVAAGKGEVYVHHNEKGSGASFKMQSCVSLKFYKNGMIVQGGPLRLYNDPKTASFIRDILDGYFPSELQETYPNGVPFKVENHRTEVYTNDVNIFPGHGYRLGKQTSKDGSSSIHLRNSKILSSPSRQCSPRKKDNPCQIEFAPSFTTRSLKSKNSTESQSIDIVSLRSQILASHNNVCSDSHLQSHINAELALSSRKEKRDLATKNTEYDLSVRERNSKSTNILRFPTSRRNNQRSSFDRSSSKLSPIRLEKINDRSRIRSRSAGISNRRVNGSSVYKSKALSEDEARMSVKSSESKSPRNPRITKSATHARKSAPPILYQINEPSGKSGELRLKVRSLNGGTVYLVHLSADDSVARLYELLNEALPATWHKGYKILVSGYSPKRLEELGSSLKECGITRDSVLHLSYEALRIVYCAASPHQWRRSGKAVASQGKSRERQRKRHTGMCQLFQRTASSILIQVSMHWESAAEIHILSQKIVFTLFYLHMHPGISRGDNRRKTPETKRKQPSTEHSILLEDIHKEISICPPSFNELRSSERDHRWT
ncbi:PREDICTED: uncharacterized protein LOC106787680 [Polistes canadensis]|uniref:uncharacterized protein LOC106787680 n=1 Tax=Polistes canadensis TaxID=91411 RepID=UPI000718E366|nr:PREDICTED: uncharacterized protein LOC106787680 [Polistes canadensis]